MPAAAAAAALAAAAASSSLRQRRHRDEPSDVPRTACVDGHDERITRRGARARHDAREGSLQCRQRRSGARDWPHLHLAAREGCAEERKSGVAGKLLNFGSKYRRNSAES